MNHIPFEEKIDEALALSAQLADVYAQLNKLFEDNLELAILHTEYAQDFEIDISHIIENRKLGSAYSSKAVRLVGESRVRRRHSKDFEKLAERLRPNLVNAERAIKAIATNASDFKRFIDARTYTCRTPEAHAFFEELPQNIKAKTVAIEPCPDSKARRYQRLNVEQVKVEPPLEVLEVKAPVAKAARKRKVALPVQPELVLDEAAVSLMVEELPLLENFDYSEGNFIYIHPAKNFAYWTLVRAINGRHTFTTKLNMKTLVEEIHRAKPDFFLAPNDKANRQIYHHTVEVMKSGKTDLYEAYAYVQDMLPLARVVTEKRGNDLVAYAKNHFERINLLK